MAGLLVVSALTSHDAADAAIDKKIVVDIDATGGNKTYDGVAAATWPGRILVVRKYDSGANTVTSNGVILRFQGETAQFYSDGSSWLPLFLLSSYGEIYENNDPTGSSIVITTGGTYYQWVTSTVGETSGAGTVVGSSSTDDMTIGSQGSGVYQIAFNATVSDDTGKTVTGGVFVNGSLSHIISSGKVATAGDRQAIMAMGTLTLVANDVVTLRFTSTTNGDTVVVYHVNLNINRLH